MTPYDRLMQLGLELPTPAVAVANYVPYVLANGFLYLSGQGPRRADSGMFSGTVGADVGIEDANDPRIALMKTAIILHVKMTLDHEDTEKRRETINWLVQPLRAMVV